VLVRRLPVRSLDPGEDLIQEIVRTKNRIEALFRRSAIKVGGAGFYKDPAVLRELPSQAKQEVARTLFEQLGLLMMQQREAYLSRFMGLR
jgi:hypothetical protein